VNLPLGFNGDRPRSVISSTIDCPYGAYTIHRDGEPEFWTTFTDLDGNTVSGSVAAAADDQVTYTGIVRTDPMDIEKDDLVEPKSDDE